MSDEAKDWEGFAEDWERAKTAKVSESAGFTGSVQNGVVAYEAICRGCAQKFEDYYMQNDGCEDPVPWCDKCIKTMGI